MINFFDPIKRNSCLLISKAYFHYSSWSISSSPLLLRWYILLVFSLVAILQDTVWNTWGPIDHTAIFLYGWSPDLVALLANYGSILYILAFIPAVYILNWSLRGAMVMCM